MFAEQLWHRRSCDFEVQAEMGGETLNKSQRRRRRVKRLKEQAVIWQSTLGSMPEGAMQTFSAVKPNTDLGQQEPWMRAPPHVVEYDEYPAIRPGKMEGFARNAAEKRTSDREQRIVQFRSLCVGILAQPRIAHIAQTRFNQWAEKNAESSISLRTAQAYLKLIRR